MKRCKGLRLHILLVLFCAAWVLLGAPLLVQEWRDVPHRVEMMLAQLPVRMSSILLHWR